MAVEREALRDWHRLFGLLLTDFFSGSPFVVEVERDLSVQQQLLDVVIVRRRPGGVARSGARAGRSGITAARRHLGIGIAPPVRIGVRSAVGVPRPRAGVGPRVHHHASRMR